MGQVYLARSTGLGGFERQVVVKTLDLSITDDDDAFVTMFLDEARLVGALHHQYIAPVYEVGCDDDGRYYLVMDYVNGETAEAVYRTSTDRTFALPLPFALTVVSCIASALDYAHGLCAADGTPLDIVHRDISLSNVMIGYDGAVKLIDFGIAKAANRTTKTQIGTLKGKIGYLAPEQILRTQVDHRADIFSLGIVLYELTTGTRAFRDASDLVTLERITAGELRRPSEVVASYPPELERIVLRALETDPGRRYQDAGTMGRELEQLAVRMGFPLGHVAVVEVMAQLFGKERRSRRRIARGSNDVQTDPNVAALDDEKTPITDVVAAIADTEMRRAQRPTIPIAKRSDKAATPIPSAALDTARIAAPIVDVPSPSRIEAPHVEAPRTTTAERKALPLAPPGVPAGRVAQHTPGPSLEVPTPRVPTGPQLPAFLFPETADDLADAPTTIAAKPMVMPPPAATATAPGDRSARFAPQSPAIARTMTPRPTPSAASPSISRTMTPRPTPSAASPSISRTMTSPVVGDRPSRSMTPSVPPPLAPRTVTAELERPVPRWSPAMFTHVVTSRVKPAVSAAMRTWFLLCALFALAVTAAILIAVL